MEWQWLYVGVPLTRPFEGATKMAVSLPLRVNFLDFSILTQ